MIQPIRPEPPELAGPTVATQEWRDLLFLHWRAEAAEIAPLLPPGTAPDEHDGSTWVGLIGFRLVNATLGAGPAIPYFGTFAEVNVRLYAVDQLGRRGVVFRSLEASRLLAVLAARAAFSIPYFWSRTEHVRLPDGLGYAARRHGGRGRSRFVAASIGPTIEPTALEHFLTARWGLFTRRFGRTILLPNTHERWELHRAEIVELDDSLVAQAGIPARGTPESVLVSPGVRARFGRPLAVPDGEGER